MVQLAVVTARFNINVIECCKCAIPFGLTAAYERQYRETHEVFYCPNGHPQHFGAESEKERLRRMLQEANDRNTALANETRTARTAGAKAEVARKRAMKRVKSGVCPCCTRTFQNLARHMATQHKDVK